MNEGLRGIEQQLGEDPDPEVSQGSVIYRDLIEKAKAGDSEAIKLYDRLSDYLDFGANDPELKEKIENDPNLHALVTVWKLEAEKFKHSEEGVEVREGVGRSWDETTQLYGTPDNPKQPTAEELASYQQEKEEQHRLRDILDN